jgi:hypothetical protein
MADDLKDKTGPESATVTESVTVARLSPEALQRFADWVAAAPLREAAEQARADALAEEARIAKAKLEEEAEAEFAAAVLRVTTGRARGAKAAKAATPEAKAAKEEAKAEKAEAHERMVESACAAAGRDAAQSATCLRDIRDHLPKDHGASDRELLEALGKVRLRIERSTLKKKKV